MIARDTSNLQGPYQEKENNQKNLVYGIEACSKIKMKIFRLLFEALII
jgi:hypothetical protein